MKTNNIELNSNLYNATYANCHDELGGQNYGKFIANMKSFDFKDGDYITLADITYGPKIHLAIYAGYDVFTANENGTVCNNPETDTKHYYLELMLLGNNEGTEDECLETVWLDEEYPNGLDDKEGFAIYDRLTSLARKYIREEINKLPSVWVVEFDGVDDNGHEGYTTLFNNYDDAKAFFDERVATEQNPDMSWAGDVYNDYKNGELDEDEYDVTDTDDTFAVTQNDEGYYVSWTLYKKEIF